MQLSMNLIVAGLLVGFLVGLTGMGGGALMTPILIMFFGVAPLAAVSSDLVASLFMKPVGAAVHLRKGTVDKRLAAWLTVSAAPAAFLGVLVLRSLGHGARVQSDIKVFLGIALLLTVASMVVKAWIASRRERAFGGRREAEPNPRVTIRPVLTVLIGVFGGLAVGMTSVGSGSLIIGMLLLAYPQLRASQLVGTDLVQAIPLVGAAAVGHAIFGDVHLPVTLSLLLGAIPAVYVGARLSATGANRLVRPVLAVVLLASALKLVNVSTDWTLVASGAWIAANLAVSALRRRRASAGDIPASDALAGQFS
ncbi:MAG TPA: sulfite exporter TauE/SafE family protein [Acidothermaceae bacterium]|nr:sulfite exporter TauE/SafE family protein [Acidothermaceae bacterium]